MTSNIITLRPTEPPEPPEPMVWTCICGCTTHLALSDGTLQCGACQQVSDDHPEGHWRSRLPPEPEAPKPIDDTNFRVMPIDTAETFLRRHKARIATARGIIVFDAEGISATWGRPGDYTQDESAWIERGLAGIRRMLQPLEPR